ncbi:MAG: hypothetical protein IJ691_07430 [Lachnospiraceae bacterium]|nr:hypothetical protein [Lachnospiraceae bacterium]
MNISCLRNRFFKKGCLEKGFYKNENLKKGCFNLRFLKRSEGFADSVYGIFIMAFFLIMPVLVIRIGAYKSLSDRLEDALAASSLAASIVDLERYGTDHTIVISDFSGSYEKYKKTLNINLKMTDGYSDLSFIDGEVCLSDFRIYNKEGGEITEIIVTDAGERISRKGKIGEIKDPAGRSVEETGIYSEISFPIKKNLLRIGGFSSEEEWDGIAKKNKLTVVRAK